MRLLFHMKAISKNDSFVDEFLQHFLFKKWVISINYKSLEIEKMKTLLQLNLESTFNKNYYRTRKNKLELTK